MQESSFSSPHACILAGPAGARRHIKTVFEHAYAHELAHSHELANQLVLYAVPTTC
jgi:hypothetical protein